MHVADELAAIEVLFRPSRWLDDPELFVERLVERLRRAVPDGESSRGDDAVQLLKGGAYNAAIIAAMSHLEATLRQRLDKQPWDEVRRPMSLRSLVDRAVDEEFIQPEARGFVLDWLPLRNNVVHTPAHATREQATQVVEGVRRILSRLE